MVDALALEADEGRLTTKCFGGCASNDPEMSIGNPAGNACHSLLLCNVEEDGELKH